VTSVADADWLRRRYLDDQATVADIAAEAGVDPATVHRALRRHDIPLRGPAGRRQWGDVLTAEFLGARKAAPATEIAEELGCSPSVVQEHRAMHGLLDLPDGLDWRAAQRLKRLYERDCLSVVQVGEAIGVSKRTARRYLLAAGVTLRARGRPRG
jgi:AcrR family transcriptional regulator